MSDAKLTPEAIQELMKTEAGRQMLAGMLGAQPKDDKAAEARKAKQKAIEEKGTEVMEHLKLAFEESELSAEVVMQVCSTALYGTQRQFFFNMRNIRNAHNQKERLQDAGMHHASDDGFLGAGEINPMRDIDRRLAYFNSVLDEYHALNVALWKLWNVASMNYAEDTGRDVTYIPDSYTNLSHSAFNDWCAREEGRSAVRQKRQQKAAENTAFFDYGTQMPAWAKGDSDEAEAKADE